MNKNSKSKKYILIAILLLITIMLGIIGGITYAKYYSKIDGKGNAEIARWSFKANNETKTIADIKLNNTYNENKLEKAKMIKALICDLSGKGVTIIASKLNMAFETIKNYYLTDFNNSQTKKIVEEKV